MRKVRGFARNTYVRSQARASPELGDS